MNPSLGICAFMALNSTFMNVPQYDELCERNPSICEQVDSSSSRLELDKKTLSIITSVNKAVNHNITPKSDKEIYGVDEYWNLPNEDGDCEDYVLLKQKLLREIGISQSNLLITIVKDENNEGHAVLTVRTNKGDYILDNKRDDVNIWANTPYHYIARQSYKNNKAWFQVDNECHK